MHRRPLIWSAATLTVVVVAATMMIHLGVDAGDSLGGVILSILTSTYPDEVAPRVVIGVLLLCGLYQVARSGPDRIVFWLACACAAIGAVAATAMAIYGETIFARTVPRQAWPDIMLVSHASALFQAAIGLAACTLLLAAASFRRPTEP